MRRYITGNKPLFSLYMVLAIVSAGLGMVFPFILSGIIDCAIRGDASFLWKLLLGSVIFIAFSVGLSYVLGRVENKISMNARNAVKCDMLSALLRKDVFVFESKESAEYLNDFLQNLDVFEQLYFSNILRIPTTLFMFSAAVITSFILEPWMLLVIVLLGAVTSVVVKKMAKRMQAVTDIYSESLSEYSGEINSDIQSFRLIKTYAIENQIKQKHRKQSEITERAKKRTLDERLAFGRLNEFAGVVTTLIIMGAASYFAIKGHFSTGIVLAFGQIAGKIIGPIMNASDLVAGLKSAKNLEVKYSAILFEEKQAEDRKSAENYSGSESNRPLEKARSGDIEVNALGFSYDDKTIFDDLNLEFRKHHSHLIVGGNGAGKSTLLMLLMGQFCDAFTGDILYDGVSIKNLELSTIPEIVAYVSQKVTLLNDTLLNNITLYHDYSEEKIQGIIEKCGLKELVEKLPDGLNTLIKDGGQNFSGGEKQKISLARGLIKDCPILILDEISANLDKESTEKLENIVLEDKNKTVISVSHKLPEDVYQKYDYILEL